MAGSYLLGRGQLCDAAAFAALEQPLPAVRPGERLDESAVDARPWAVSFAVWRDDQLPSAALPDGSSRTVSGRTATLREGADAERS